MFAFEFKTTMKNLPKITLRKIKKTDLPYFLKWWRDENLIKFTSGIFEESKDVLRGYFLSMFRSSKNHYIILLNKNIIIGNISLTPKSKNIFEIQVVIGEKKYLGRGLGTLAIKKALKLGFNKLGYKKAYLEVRPDNIRAIKAYLKCGFIKDGIKRYPKNKAQPIVIKMYLKKKRFLT